MRVIWTPEAEQDRDDIWNYIAADNPVAATLMDELFSDAAARLVTYPMLGRPDRNLLLCSHALLPHQTGASQQ